MEPIKNFPDPPPEGLTLAIENAGVFLVNESGVWKADDVKKAESVIASYDPAPFAKAEKAAQLADERWKKETGGFMFQPQGASRAYLFKSTRESMGPVLGAVLALQAGVLPQPLLWKTAEDNLFVPLKDVDIVPFYKAFANHVALAFAEEAAKQEQLATATIDEIPSIVIEAAPAVVP